jgi:hypothetical protein
MDDGFWASLSGSGSNVGGAIDSMMTVIDVLLVYYLVHFIIILVRKCLARE